MLTAVAIGPFNVTIVPPGGLTDAQLAVYMAQLCNMAAGALASVVGAPSAG